MEELRLYMNLPALNIYQHRESYHNLKSYFVIAMVISFPVLTSPATYARFILDSGVLSSDLDNREYIISTSSKQHSFEVTCDSKLGSEAWVN